MWDGHSSPSLLMLLLFIFSNQDRKPLERKEGPPFLARPLREKWGFLCPSLPVRVRRPAAPLRKKLAHHQPRHKPSHVGPNRDSSHIFPRLRHRQRNRTRQKLQHEPVS